MFPLPTDTAHVRIESRQYRLLNIDLGEGVARSTLKVAALIFLPWMAVILLLGAPMWPAWWWLVWVAPPAIVIGRCVRRDSSGRVGLAGYLDLAQFRSHRSRRLILNGETARVDRGEKHVAEFAVIERIQT